MFSDSSLQLERFKYNENDELACTLCGSENVIILPKAYSIHYQCTSCGNEEHIRIN
jgi:predicted RNA-binding Zn-ribbon protein involved in translation (DUF1610 family)